MINLLLLIFTLYSFIRIFISYNEIIINKDKEDFRIILMIFYIFLFLGCELTFIFNILGKL